MKLYVSGFAALCSVLLTHPIMSAPLGLQPSQSSLVSVSLGVFAARANCRDITLYGGDNGGARDTTPALAAAITAAQISPSRPGQICIYFPAGSYKFNSPQEIGIPASFATGSIAIRGDGPDATKLNFVDGTSGLSITLATQFQSVHLHDFSVLAGSASATNTGIRITQTQLGIANPANTAVSDISYVNVRGNDGYGAKNAFGIGIALDQVSNVNLISNNITGPLATNTVCIQITGTPKTIAVVFSLTAITANYCNVGLFYGAYVQGVTIVQSNFTGDNYGVFTAAAALGMAQLSIGLTQFNDNKGDIMLETAPDGVQIIGNNFYLTGAGTIGVNVEAALAFTIEGNTFHGLGPSDVGIGVQSYAASAGIISGNVFRNLESGIVLAKNSQQVTVGTNSYDGSVGTALFNNGKNNLVPATCFGIPTPLFSVTGGVITHC